MCYPSGCTYVRMYVIVGVSGVQPHSVHRYISLKLGQLSYIIYVNGLAAVRICAVDSPSQMPSVSSVGDVSLTCVV